MTIEKGTGPASPTEPTEPTEPIEPGDPGKPTEPTEPTEPEPLFTPEQEQHMGTMFGRIVAKQLEEKVMPHLSKDPDTTSLNIPNAGSEDAVTKFNEGLQQKIFEGDVVGAVQAVIDVSNRAKANLTKAQTTETDKLMTNLSDKPYYKDIFSDMKNIAHDNVGKGIPPQIAVELAHAKAKASYFEKKLGGGDGEETENLEMLGGGKTPPKTKGLTLSPAMKKAAQRDITDGLYKDEKEWAENLDPRIRKQYGLD